MMKYKSDIIIEINDRWNGDMESINCKKKKMKFTGNVCMEYFIERNALLGYLFNGEQKSFTSNRINAKAFIIV